MPPATLPTRSFARFSLALLLVLALATPAAAQVIFSAQQNGPNGPVTGLFAASNGSVSPIATGLASNEFAFLSRNGRTMTISAADPAQPNEASTDLFLHDLVAGQTFKLFDNTTTAQPDGSFLFASPLFSRASDSASLVAFVNLLASSNNQGQGGAVKRLLVVRGSDGFLLSSAEIGHGNAIDFYESEFVGISWFPQSAFFATSAYVSVTTNTGRQTVAAGLVLYGPGQTGQYQRTQILTIPQVFDTGGQIIAETHAYPAFSPDGQLLAFFRIVYPSAVMTAPAQADLIVANLATGNGTVLASFNPGVLPLALSWSADMGQLVFSLASQQHVGNQYPAAADAGSAVLRSIDLNTLQIGTVPGAPVGYFPNVIGVGQTIFRNGFE